MKLSYNIENIEEKKKIEKVNVESEKNNYRVN